MKKLFALTLLSLFASGAYAAAADSANPQQEKMKACNTSAGDKKGDERKAYMKTCLSAKPEKKESKMAMCNKKTAGMSKDDRAKAQSECMKAS
jgi:psiF repeat